MIGCSCTGARLINGETGGLSTGAYTLYQIRVETTSGATFEVNKRFSDFETLHEAFIAPVSDATNTFLQLLLLVSWWEHRGEWWHLT